jgi:hypothetical protein
MWQKHKIHLANFDKATLRVIWFSWGSLLGCRHAAKLFGWDTEKPGVQINQLAITTEQLQEIRALREQAGAQECAEKR